ncbi:uncharacterized protein LOC125489539 [Plutella xylostella]|uniref:uncharacterized protein LOC125489539 n=1 Tax=Plutella xylostella TaxID=51655 RepID=UPI002032415D|nr:uncharacterized protein LOC125489539 [Plutella xylostella]
MQVIKGKVNEPYATLTPLGWCLHGCVPHSPAGAACHSSLLVCCREPEEDSECQRILRDMHDEVRRSFTIESMGVSQKPRQNSLDVQAVNHLDRNSVLLNGRWYVGLPWKTADANLPNSKPNAMKRLENVEKKMKANEGFSLRYRERVQHLLDNDFAEELTCTRTSPRIWYLPHFGVDNPNKKKLRLVYDAAAKTDGFCLNDYLLTGPDLLMSLYGIMLRFREKRIAVTGDIKDMFLRIKINPEDQDALRFLWRDQPEVPVKTYVMTSLIFGASCSPFIAQYVKNKNALRYESSMPAAVHAICKQHYADDYIDSIDDENTAIQLVKDIVYIHSQGGFEIRNWTSNCSAVLDGLPQESLGNTAVNLNMDQHNQGERTLGLIWYPKNDCLSFDVSLKKIPENIRDGSKKPTKREMLRVIMSIFDILGFLSPFTIKGKIMLQCTWKNGLQWDDVITDSIHEKWSEWITLLQRVGSLSVPRYYQIPMGASEKEDVLNVLNNIGPVSPSNSDAPPPTGYTNLQLHIFCDATTQAMCAVAYWRWETNVIRTAFVSSKCRVAPVKHMSVPRLELQAALLGARLADNIEREHTMKPIKRIFWSDSSTVLHWIKNDARNYKSFIAHRLGEIDELTHTSEWRYVPTSVNVADVATRETCEFSVFENEWFHGPAFLLDDESSWPRGILTPQVNELDLECVTVVQTNPLDTRFVPDPLKFSSWLRLLRSTSVMISFIDIKIKKLTGVINGDMMIRAERLLIKYAQMQSFPDDLKDLKKINTLSKLSKLLTLSPYLDDFGILRVGGRIEAARDVPADMKHPVILDGRHHIARLIVKHLHIRAAHGNHETVVNELKQKYWVLKIRPTVKRVAMECMVCRIRKAEPRPPRMGDLPEARMAHHQRPFTFCGLDLFGPMEVTVGRRREKRYGVLFTCLTVRAIHIELVATLTTDSLIMALRRQACRRGWAQQLFSDNGTNLRGADTELRRSIQDLDQQVLKSAAINYGTTWTFIPPTSPHWGGAWERLIRSVKVSLKIILRERAPREEVLLTLMAEVEQIVNSRPLTHVSVEPGSSEALTPNHFLLGSSSNLPVLGEFCESDLYLRKQWRISQRLADMYWSRWVKEFLPELIPRRKWTDEVPPIKVGDLVVIVDGNAPRNMWLRGVVEAVLPGKDERVRVVDVRTRAGLVRRPATRVATIPVG